MFLKDRFSNVPGSHPIEGEFIPAQSWASRAWSKTKAVGSQVGVAVSAGVVGAQAFAVDHSAAITAATGDGETSVLAAASGIIAIVAVVVGIGLIIGVLKKS